MNKHTNSHNFLAIFLAQWRLGSLHSDQQSTQSGRGRYVQHSSRPNQPPRDTMGHKVWQPRCASLVSSAFNPGAAASLSSAEVG